MVWISWTIYFQQGSQSPEMIQVSAILMYINMFPGLIPQLYSLPLLSKWTFSRLPWWEWDLGSKVPLRPHGSNILNHNTLWLENVAKQCSIWSGFIATKICQGYRSAAKVHLRSLSNSFWTYKQHAMTTWTGHMTRHQSVSTKEL